ncbi:peptide ligase PGM1-related protein [Streptomyces catenulae]|uniref:Peptide ligase PGM1-related protein n=1 Tax=Streptomyces catenulae TaxID=66875 RepID=A0ABV2YZ85_9ACTN|nr:peptide ligase PGM1-related protein [Streptomyces catenulae]
MRILVLNVGTAAARAIHRQLWMIDEGDVVVSPIAVDETFLRYVCGALGIDPDAVRLVVHPDGLTDPALVAPGLVARLRAAVGDADAYLAPAAHTEGVAALAGLLGLPLGPGLRFAAQRGPVLLNRKSHFRQLAVGAGLPVPDGSVVTGARALTDAVARHLPRTGTVVVKRDDDLGGQGNIAVTLGPTDPLPGVARTLSAADPRAAAESLWAELTDADNRLLVVESYHPATHSFYTEYLIAEDGGVTFLNSGGIRRCPDPDPDAEELVWVGLELPAELPPGAASRALTAAARMVALAAAVGYRGHINVDAILTTEGEVLFNEVNARWGGSLALHTLGTRLLGPNYADHHVISGLRDITPLPVAEALRVLDATGLAFSAGSGEGVVLVGCDPRLGAPLECVAIAPSRARARQIEDRLRRAVARPEAVASGRGRR